MTILDEDRIRTIVQRVVAHMGTGEAATPALPPASPRPAARPASAPGVFPDVEAAIAAATAAQRAWGALTLERRGEILDAMRQTARDNAALLARLACEETSMGRIEDKVQKNLLVANKTPGI